MILFIDTTEKMVKIGSITSRHTELDPNSIQLLEFEGGRELDSLILVKIDEVLANVKASSKDLTGIIVNVGPGSFTGLRIGLSVANTLGYSLNVPIAGIANEKDENKIIQIGLNELQNKSKFEKSVMAEYGIEPNITKPKGSNSKSINSK